MRPISPDHYPSRAHAASGWESPGGLPRRSACDTDGIVSAGDGWTIDGEAAIRIVRDEHGGAAPRFYRLVTPALP
jgi:hypothetical protein